jgi:hypothetical protein
MKLRPETRPAAAWWAVTGSNRRGVRRFRLMLRPASPAVDHRKSLKFQTPICCTTALGSAIVINGLAPSSAAASNTWPIYACGPRSTLSRSSRL